MRSCSPQHLRHSRRFERGPASPYRESARPIAVCKSAFPAVAPTLIRTPEAIGCAVDILIAIQQNVVLSSLLRFFVRSRKRRSSSRRLCSGPRGGREGSRGRNATRSLAALPPSVACVSQPLRLSGCGETMGQGRADNRPPGVWMFAQANQPSRVPKPLAGLSAPSSFVAGKCAAGRPREAPRRLLGRRISAVLRCALFGRTQHRFHGAVVVDCRSRLTGRVCVSLFSPLALV